MAVSAGVAVAGPAQPARLGQTGHLTLFGDGVHRVGSVVLADCDSRPSRPFGLDVPRSGCRSRRRQCERVRRPTARPTPPTVLATPPTVLASGQDAGVGSAGTRIVAAQACAWYPTACKPAACRRCLISARGSFSILHWAVSCGSGASVAVVMVPRTVTSRSSVQPATACAP